MANKDHTNSQQTTSGGTPAPAEPFVPAATARGQASHRDSSTWVTAPQRQTPPRSAKRSAPEALPPAHLTFTAQPVKPVMEQMHAIMERMQAAALGREFQEKVDSELTLASLARAVEELRQHARERDAFLKQSHEALGALTGHLEELSKQGPAVATPVLHTSWPTTARRPRFPVRRSRLKRSLAPTRMRGDRFL